jgi:hypothetical protein
LSDRKARQLRDALILLASLGVVLGALLSHRSQRRRASLPAAVASTAAPPPPLPSGAERERIAVAEPETAAGCGFADRGFGAYERWRPLPLGKVLVPPARAIGADGGYDLLVHFHGAEPIRKLLAPMDLELVIVGVDAGTRSSHYARALADGAWDTLLRAVDREVADAAGLAGARARHVALSSWSAGSGAVSRVIERGSSSVDALMLLDSLYGSYAPGFASLMPGQLGSFVALAGAAARGGALFYLTHTDIPTNGYASTRETAAFLLRELGASSVAVTTTGEASPTDSPSTAALGQGDALRLTSMYDGGSLYVRGYAGTGPEGHCAQLRLLPAVLIEHVLPAFGR